MVAVNAALGEDASGEKRDKCYELLVHSSICLCIQPYVPIQPELNDIDRFYQRFGFVGRFLSAQMLGPPTIVDASSIIFHVAVTPLKIRGYDVLHVLPMDKG